MIQIRYFVGENEGRGVDQKGSIPIFYYTTAMFSSRELIVTNPSRAFELTGESLEEVAAWGVALKKLIRLLSPDFSAEKFDSAARKDAERVHLFSSSFCVVAFASSSQ